MIDTSALYALMDRDDEDHEKGEKTWAELLEFDAPFAEQGLEVIP